jgi:hypothetical protein
MDSVGWMHERTVVDLQRALGGHVRRRGRSVERTVSIGARPVRGGRASGEKEALSWKRLKDMM